MNSKSRPKRRLGLDLASIRLALTIAEHRSLRRAALGVGLSESALSHRLRALEEALTVSLFHRSSEGVEPTQAGLVFFRQARQALHIIDLAVANAAATSVGKAGRLTLGLYTSLASGQLRDALSDYRQAHPDIEFDFVEAARSRLVEGLNSRAIDIAVLLGPADMNLGEALPLWREQIHVAMNDGHRLAQRSQVSWADLIDETFLVSTEGAGPEAASLLAARQAEQGQMPRIRSHAVSRETIFSMVSMGFGVSLMIDSGLGRCPSGVVAVPLMRDHQGAQVQFTAYRDPGNDNPPLRRFWSLLKTRYSVPTAGGVGGG
jgi:DNA-binding transcriptional LysR family regulator